MKYNRDKVIDTFEQELRNTMIFSLYEFMIELEMKYSARIDWLSKKFFLSDKRIEEIIKDYRSDDGK